MPPFKQVKERLCRCGCGLPVEKIYQGARFKGYARFAKDCPTAEQRKHAKNPSKGHKKETHHKWKPDGTRRLQHIGKGLYYWFIKVDGKWVGEHRHIMQKILGVPLPKNKHVHHKDHNTLNNSLDNLCVLSIAEHTKHHFAPFHEPLKTWTKNDECCIDCGTTERPHAGKGRCGPCRGKYQRQTFPEKLRAQQRASYQRNREQNLIRQKIAWHAKNRFLRRARTGARARDGWSFDHACCIDCQTTERNHQGGGLCTRCYGRQWYHRKH